ncbi:autotransporter domain-containing protein, partial [Endozoicomonas sp.]|uniref:autotransporter domain-containing protein n=1 Tax=Endozoicomonas sp. TaxID=1892382 RepID=UPI00383A5FCA
IGFKANIRGLGLQLVQNTHWGHWGGGLFSGKGDINSTEFNTPIRSDVDYLGGLIQGAVKVNPWVVNLGITYLHSKHHLRQYNHYFHLKSDSEIDVAGIQAGMAWPQYYGDWLVTPAAHLEFWHTHQPGNEITGDGNKLYVRSKGSQDYRQLPLSLTVQGPNLISGSHAKVRLIPQFDIRFIPTWGDRQLSTEVSLKNDTGTTVEPVVLSTPEMDKTSTELGVGLQVARGLIDGNLRYNARHSSHTLSQQISADIVWRF